MGKPGIIIHDNSLKTMFTALVVVQLFSHQFESIWIISAVITIVAAMLLYGVFTAKSQRSDGASVIQVSST